MSKNWMLIIIIAIGGILLGWGEKIIPIKLELSDTQVVELMGIDKDKSGNVSLSLVFEPHAGEGEHDSEEKVLSITAQTFVATEKGLQNYEDKIFIGSHIKDIVVGEEIALTDLARGMDYIAKHDELRLDSKVYIAKEMRASDVFLEGVDNSYILSNRVDNLSLAKKGYEDTRVVEVLDIIDILLTDEKVGVIPAIQIVDNGEEQQENYLINTSPDEKRRVELAGYGVIKGGKLIGYLGNDESTGYDYIKNLVAEEDITLAGPEGIVGLRLINSNSSIKFEFLGDTLNKVLIKVKTDNSILENSSGKNIFDKELKIVENAENEHIENIIKTAIEYAQNKNADFIGIGEQCRLKHPYKWRKIKDNWNEIFPTIPIEVEVDSKIDEEYGILSITNRS